MNKVDESQISNNLKIAMVGYLNTIPMVYGLNRSVEDYNLTLEIPAKCYDLFEYSNIDVALLPVGVLPMLTDANIVTDYCIGCLHSVRTVCIFSNSPISKVKTVYLDDHSKTSVQMTKLLMKEHWKKTVTYIDLDVQKMDLSKLKSDEAVLMIGDKVFEVEGKFVYKYDLGEQWFEYCGKPFAFAVWVAKSHVTKEQIKKLNNDLAFGVNHISESLKSYHLEEKAFDLSRYFKENIDYNFDRSKQESMALYLDKIESSLLDGAPIVLNK